MSSFTSLILCSTKRVFFHLRWPEPIICVLVMFLICVFQKTQPISMIFGILNK